MTVEERRAAEIQKAAKAATAKSRADADEDNDNGKKLDQLLSHIGSIKTEFSDGMSALKMHCDALSSRMDAIEAARAGDDDDDEGTNKIGEGDKAKKIAADSDGAAGLAEVQARFDSLAQEHGLRAPGPMVGEFARNYRLRMLRKFQRHSTEFRDADFTKIVDLKTLDGIEQRIASDSHEAAMHPVVERGRLLEIQKPDATGRIISTFHGQNTFIRLMSRPPRYIKSVRRDWK